MKFWEIVPIEHLLARLREESSTRLSETHSKSTISSTSRKIVLGLVTLLQETYFPLQKESKQWAIRCVSLIQTDPRFVLLYLTVHISNLPKYENSK
jgi:hypothetical protein